MNTNLPKKETDSRSFSARIGQAFQRYLLTGLATLFPAAVTILLLLKIFQFSDGLLGRYLSAHIPGLGLLLTIFILLAVGFLSTHFFGRFVFPTVELWFGRLPLIRQIYPAVKQLTQFLFNDGKSPASFRRVVLVEYPRPHCYSIAFVTNEAQTSATGAPTMLLTLLIPTPPSPFSGPLVFVPEEDVIPLTMPIEEALKLIFSGGVVSSPLTARPSQQI